MWTRIALSGLAAVLSSIVVAAGVVAVRPGVRVTGWIAPYKDSSTRVDVIVDRGGMAGTVDNAQVRVVGGSVYVHGVKPWSVYADTDPQAFARMEATVGSGWVRAGAAGMPNSSEDEAIKDLRDLSALEQLVHEPLLFSPIPLRLQATGPGIDSYELTLSSLRPATGDTAPQGARDLCSLQPSSIQIPGCKEAPELRGWLSLQLSGAYSGQLTRIPAYCDPVHQDFGFAHLPLPRPGATPLSISGNFFPIPALGAPPSGELDIGPTWDQENNTFDGPIVVSSQHLSARLVSPPPVWSSGPSVSGTIVLTGTYWFPTSRC